MKTKTDPTQQIKIEHNIPVPKGHANGFSAALRMLEVGDSIFLKGKNSSSVSTMVFYAARSENKKFTCRTMDGGVRVWRIA